MSDLSFYRAFEDKLRGGRELIKSRLEQYSPFLDGLKKSFENCSAIDIGCGRGEWLELLNEKKFTSIGIDLDAGMLDACVERGFNVKNGDGIEFLSRHEENSFHLVSAFHVVEHISFEQLQTLIKNAYRVLVPGGLLILETPNPENLVVASSNFYLDPTHSKPVPPLLLSFLTEYEGFDKNKLVRLQEPEELREKTKISISELLYGVSPDYSVVAQKPADKKLLRNFDSAFDKDYGLALSDLSTRFDARVASMENHYTELEAKSQELEAKSQELEAKSEKLESRIFEVEVNAAKAIEAYYSILNSISWRVTKPLRVVKAAFKNTTIGLINFMASIPLAKKAAKYLFSHFPSLRKRINKIRSVENFEYAELNSYSQNSEILVDLTHVYKGDLRTGIQRVVRSIYGNLQAILDEKGYEGDVKGIYLTPEDNVWLYKYTDTAEIVVPKENDVFIGLDLNSDIVCAETSGLFNDWKHRGVRTVFVVYDILPIAHPEWWPHGVGLRHQEWLDTVLAVGSSVFCISKTVQAGVQEYYDTTYKGVKDKLITLDYFYLGADIHSSKPSFGIPNNAKKILHELNQRKTFLMVGTLEPRKGHLQVIRTFEELWKNGHNVNLVIVGKEGWMVEGVVKLLRDHAELNKRLFWLDGVSDEYLEKIYKASTCLIAASEGEGFGLPLIEAAQHKIPILARDLPVFVEVAGEHAYFLPSENSPSMWAEALIKWLELFSNGTYPRSDDLPWFTWKESSKNIVNKLELVKG